jgi:hypothetical protein
MATLAEQKLDLERRLSAAAGEPVEITFRTDRDFTASFPSTSPATLAALTAALGLTAPEVATDPEVGTFVYFSA